jgi:hypothetical protein
LHSRDYPLEHLPAQHLRGDFIAIHENSRRPGENVATVAVLTLRPRAISAYPERLAETETPPCTAMSDRLQRFQSTSCARGFAFHLFLVDPVTPVNRAIH